MLSVTRNTIMLKFNSVISAAKNISKTALVSSTLLAGQFAYAGGSMDISLSEDTARIAFDAAKMGSGLHLAFAAQHHMDDGDIFSIGTHVVDVRDNQKDLYIGIGANTYGVFTDVEDGAALGVGGFIRYNFPDQKDWSLAGYSYYAPAVTSFSGIDNLFDFDIRLQFAVIPTARVFTGYRYTSISFEDASGNYKLGDGLHLGIKLDF